MKLNIACEMNVLFLLCSGRFHEEDFASQRTKGNLSWIEPKISTKCLTNLRNLNLLKRKSLALSRVLFFVFLGQGERECACESVCRKRRARSDFIRFLTASFRLVVLEYYLGSFQVFSALKSKLL